MDQAEESRDPQIIEPFTDEVERLSEQLAAEFLRHARVKELLAELSRPIFVWRAANGILSYPDRSMAWATDKDRDAMTRSAETRRRNAERDIDKAVRDWFVKHYDVAIFSE